MNRTFPRRSKIIVNGLLVICSSVITILLIELLSGGVMTHKIKQFHNRIVTYHRLLTSSRWPIGAYRYHETIGFQLTPSFSGPLENNAFYLKTHHLGYRTPKFAGQESFEPGGILSVGCSFTFGDGVECEETFSYLAAKRLNLPSYNYGVCSYSYAGIILQLEDLQKRGILEKLKPSLVILGAGNWLLGRSLNPFYPTPDLQFAYAYIGKKDNRLQVMQPDDFYSTKHLYRLVDRYFNGSGSRKVKLTLGRYLRLISISPRVSKANLDQRNFKKPRISSRELYDFVIGKMTGILRKYGATIVILRMPYLDEEEIDAGLVESIKGFENVLLVDGLKALKKYNVSRECYYKRHPSVEAHAAYARALMEAITGACETVKTKRGGAK
ncbi:MAG: hypothetical protein NT166_18910 [Candidatus Aminicenantes bacterium]|nr:hypothetical protein [Candidatus Aminicenantes bacterium]